MEPAALLPSAVNICTKSLSLVASVTVSALLPQGVNFASPFREHTHANTHYNLAGGVDPCG